MKRPLIFKGLLSFLRELINMLDKTLVFISDVSPLCDPAVFDRLYSSVSKERQEKIDRLKNEKEKRLSLGAYALLLRALSRIGINDILIEYGEFGKPYLSGVEGVYFSLSHSGERVMCVLSPLDVGCDVEAVQDRSLSVAERFFAPEEAAYIESISDADLKRDAFFRLWTLKESFVKCLGTGLNLPLDSFSVDISKKDVTLRQSCTRSPVYFREYLISDSYRCAVCGQYPRFGELEIVEIA